MKPLPQDRVLVLDFGGQYNQLIARRVREAHVYCEMLPYNTPLAAIMAFNPRGIILTGGPASVYGQGAPRCDPGLFTAGIPLLGICYGMQLMAALLGGQVRAGDKREYGKAEIQVGRDDDPLFAGLPAQQQVWMSHGDLLTDPPPGFYVSARTDHTPVAAMSDPERGLYGVQFHPEVRHTRAGQEILQRFLYQVCGLQGTWTSRSFIQHQVEELRQRIGNRRVLAALSGGVDSTVASLLVHKAVGDQLVCVFVDNGLLRQGEREQVQQALQPVGLNLVVVDAAERFLQQIQGVSDPEQKRKLIGREFISVFEAEARRLGRMDFLVQGTLYPDIIESGTATAATIKTHHNVGGLPDKMELELIEPLRMLFKDEVREVGQELGLPGELVWRQPFPGPGLAVRVLGEVTPERVAILRQVDAIVTHELETAGLARELWQYFAVLPDMRSVGVMGDQRTYAYPAIIRAVTSDDAMTADWARLPYPVLERVANRIVNEVEQVNRVAYDITSKPPGTIEWE